MPSKLKRKLPEVVGAATTDSLAARARDLNGSKTATRSVEPSLDAESLPRGSMEATNADTHLALMRSCAEALLPSDIAAAHEVFAKLAPALELDAFAAFVPTSGEHALTFETSSGVMETAISATAISTIVAGLERDGRRMLVLDALARNSDSRAPPFHDLGFASVIVGALMTDGRLLGAIVLASRSRERFAAAELTLIDAVVCCLAAAYERRDLARHRSDSENRKQKFLNVLAHELRNPLAPLRNALEIIRADDRMRSAVEHSAYAMIERQLQQIGRLADDLLDANQVILGQVELTKRRVLLDAVVERAAAQSRPWVEAARHSLVIDLPREAIALDADSKRLSRALSNLINNAARRMDRGGRIVLSAESFNSTATVFVRARGRTLSRQALKGLFVDDDTYDGSNHGASQSGVAAGMTLVKHLVELHGGIVTARIGGDAVIEFEVQLPIFHAALPVARKSARPPVDEEAETIPHRILIADDNADSAESMGMLLRLMGNDVRIANDGLEAVEQAATFQPDIVLMDIGMPRLDGYEAARRIRNQEWSRDTLLVAVTGWGPSDDNAEATAAGFDRHFTKPLDPAELRRLVSAVRPH